MHAKRRGEDGLDDCNTNDLYQRPPKRLKSQSQKTLTASHYTIAWVCALYLEMSAALAMLDEVHGDLPQSLHDSNTYTLGRIGQHNIVIACLPAMQYGTVRASGVLTHLIRSFPSVQLTLMVGVGGGVPSPSIDIRLGDVVVGTRVMPYDLGKVLDGGVKAHIDQAKVLSRRVGTAVTSIRSKHELWGSKMQPILDGFLGEHRQYRRPEYPDRLFRATYSHGMKSDDSCVGCDISGVIRRSPRGTSSPVIHYGAIASGNEVIKDAISRDMYARELHDIICFEMEAAGLMDEMPCLPIRGICDYADSHKNKAWQKYAAAVAAAYAREFVEMLPFVKVVEAVEPQPVSPVSETSETETSEADKAKRLIRRRRLFASLQFTQLDSRRTTIKAAYAKTCQWLLDLALYRRWAEDEETETHHGFLWIRGKPGVGKSTMMKFVYMKMKMQDGPGRLTMSFFFNARGEHLEKSVVGMYRSLLHQLLTAFPDLQAVFDDEEMIPSGQLDEPLSLDVLKHLFQAAVLGLEQRLLTCYIDALDECDEQQVMDMVRFFEDLACDAVKTGIRFKVCFSSRHYPYIDIQKGIRLVLEDLPGHHDDLNSYIRSNLSIQDQALMKELEARLLEKSAGVFLWVVLVVDILNKENRRGGFAVRKRLEEIPTGLADLFKDLIRRDDNNLEDMRLCICLILCSIWPLRPDEYYHAIWSGLAMRDLADRQAPSTRDLEDGARRCIVSSSKGLAEITKGTQPVVQFIHESIRDYLIKDGGLYELWPDLGTDWEATFHNTLRNCCIFYLQYQDAETLGRKGSSQGQFPFIKYAAHCVLRHADAAAVIHAQDDFLASFALGRWIGMRNATAHQDVQIYAPDSNLIYILADRGHAELIRCWQKTCGHPPIGVLGEEYRTSSRYQHPLFAALARGKAKTVRALLDIKSTVFQDCDIAEVPIGGIAFGNSAYKGRTPLTWAAGRGLLGFVLWLLEAGLEVELKDRDDHTALSRALESGQLDVCKALIARGADVSLVQSSTTPLIVAARVGDVEFAEQLFRYAADRWSQRAGDMLRVNGRDADGRTALSWAARGGHERIVRLLVDNSADRGIMDRDSKTAGMLALEAGHLDIVEFLDGHSAGGSQAKNQAKNQAGKKQPEHARGRPVNGNRGATSPVADSDAGEAYKAALVTAARKGHHEIARAFIRNDGSLVNTRSTSGVTVTQHAAAGGHAEVVELLVKHGADVDALNDHGWSALMLAARQGHIRVARILVASGANLDTKSWIGETATSLAMEGGHHEIVALISSMSGLRRSVETDLYGAPASLSADEKKDLIVKRLSLLADSEPVL